MVVIDLLFLLSVPASAYVAQDPGTPPVLSLSQQIEQEAQAEPLKDAPSAVPVAAASALPARPSPARPALNLPDGPGYSNGNAFDGSGTKPAASLGAASSGGGAAGGAAAGGKAAGDAAKKGEAQDAKTEGGCPDCKGKGNCKGGCKGLCPLPQKGLHIPDIPNPIDVTPRGWFQPTPELSAAPGTADEETVARIAQERGMKVGIVLAAYREAKRQGVDYRLILAIIKQESSFNPTICSGAGACGLMQLMPATGKSVGVAPSERSDPVKNIRGGVTYLKGLFNQFVDFSWAQLQSLNPAMLEQVKSAIAAYNAGPGAVKKYGGKVPPYQETRDYVVKVLRNYVEYRSVFPQ